MNYIQQAFQYKHDFWRYLVGSLLIVIASVIGQVPFTLAVFLKAFKDGKDLTALNQNDLMGLLEPNLNLFLLLISFAFGLAGLFIIVKTLHKQTIVSLTTARKKMDWKRIWFAFFFWGIISSGLVLADYYMNPEGYEYNFELNRFIILAIIAIVLIPIQTSLEEYIFRGYLMQGFASGTLLKKFPMGIAYFIIGISLYVLLYSQLESVFFIAYQESLLGNIGLSASFMLAFIAIVFVIFLLIFIDLILTKMGLYDSDLYNRIYEVCKNKVIPLLLTSLIFGMLHIANPEVEKLGYSIMIYYIGTGLFLGIITLMDDGMELALGFHAANNLFTALLVTANWTAFQTHSILKDTAKPSLEFVDLALPVFIIFPILLFIFGKVYKWTHWKEKLFGKIEAPAS